VGPKSRDVIGAVFADLDVSNEAFPFMAWRDTTLDGVPVRVARVSFSGELAYEVNVDGWHAPAMWDRLIVAGMKHHITPYGTETMHVLRAEKGYPIIGQDTDGTVTPQDLGMSRSRCRMTLARRDYLPLAVIAKPVVWPVSTTVMILEGFTHRRQSARTEFVQIAAADTKAGRHV
jgi:hypothetical protein